MQYVFHTQQFVAFAFHHFGHGNARHTRHDFGNFFRAHFGAEQSIGGFQAACTLHFFQLQGQFGQFSVFQLRSLAVIARTLGLLDFMFDFIDVRLQIGQVHGRGFFSLPHFVQIGIFFFQTGNFFVNQSQTFFARLVAFFGNVHFLHFQLDDTAVEFVHLLGFGFFLDFDAAGRFVNQINGFIGQEAVGNIAVGQFCRRHNRRIGNFHAVVDFVAVLQAAQNRNRVFHARLAHQHFLETTFQRGIFFNILAVFVQRGRTDAVQFAARQGRFQHIARVHSAVCFTCAHQCMNFVNKNQCIAIVLCQIVQHGFQALFKFAAVFRAGNQSRQIQYQQAFAAQGFGHFAVHDALRQAFHNRGFADTGFANQHGIVFGTPLQYLNGAADFVVTADNGVEFAAARPFG